MTNREGMGFAEGRGLLLEGMGIQAEKWNRFDLYVLAGPHGRVGGRCKASCVCGTMHTTYAERTACFLFAPFSFGSFGVWPSMNCYCVEKKIPQIPQVYFFC